MKIPLINLKDQFAPLRDQMLAAISQILDTQEFVLGSEVKALEDEVAPVFNDEARDRLPHPDQMLCCSP